MISELIEVSNIYLCKAADGASIAQWFKPRCVSSTIAINIELGSVGFMSVISRLPNSNLGIAVFSNDDLYGTAIIEIIKHRIIDEALDLDPIDWNTRCAFFVLWAPH